MAYVEGESLADRLARGRFDDCREAVRLACQVCEALEAVHEKGVVHRDLKPANILLDRQGRAVLTDFGLACLLESQGERLTADGAIVGTPAYMAPEQATRGGAVGPRTDLYSLGAVLYHMLTGRGPFAGTPLAMVFQVAQEAPPPPSASRPELDPALVSIVKKAMARAPRQRYADAGQMRPALEGWLAGRPRRRARWPAVAAAAVLLATTAALGVVFSLKTEHGTIEVEVPNGAKVVIDGGKVVIESPGLKRVELRVGEHTVRLIEGDREIETRNITIRRGGEALKVEWRGPSKSPEEGRESSPFPPIPAVERFAWQPKGLVAVFGSHRWRHADAGFSNLLPLGFDATGTDVLVTTCSWRRNPDKDFRLTVTSASTGKETASLDCSNWLAHAVSTDGAAIAAVDGTHDDWTLRVVEAATGKEKLRHRSHGPIVLTALALGPGGRLFVLHKGDDPHLWDVETGKDLGMFPSNMSGRRIVAFSADGKLLATYVIGGRRSAN